MIVYLGEGRRIMDINLLLKLEKHVFDEAKESRGLTRKDIVILSYIKSNKFVKQMTLRDECRLDRGVVSRRVNRLVEKGYIEVQDRFLLLTPLAFLIVCRYENIISDILEGLL